MFTPIICEIFLLECIGCYALLFPSFRISYFVLRPISSPRSVYDFTNYVSEHPTSKPPDTSIIRFANEGILEYPDIHPMSYFEDLKVNADLVTYVARYGDKMTVDDFAGKLRITNDPEALMAIADNLGGIMVRNKVQANRDGGVLVCGSPNEVAPDPTFDDYFDVVHNDLDCVGCANSYRNYYAQKQTVWAMSVLEGEDQLCQRMAWALYELLNVGVATAPGNTETNLYTYDIFTRHCFGNYFDILKEMTYSPKMGEQFNFVESSSARFLWDIHGLLVFPDENYGQ